MIENSTPKATNRKSISRVSPGGADMVGVAGSVNTV